MQNPRQRYNIQQVMQHEWFQTGLPPGAKDLTKQSMRQQVQLQASLLLMHALHLQDSAS